MAPTSIVRIPVIGSLQQVALTGEHGGGLSQLDVVVVPEAGCQISRSVLDVLYCVAPRAQVFEYQYTLSRDPHTIWTSLIESGNDLLQCLQAQGTILNTDETSQRPLIFLCHGLGGIVVKRVYGVLDERYYDPKSKNLLGRQSGVILLGTPHLTYGKHDLWPRLTLLLQSCAGLTKNAALQAQEEVATVANVCVKFEEAGLDVPVISAFEGKETKIFESLYRSRRVLLVDRDFAETAVMQEKLVMVDADHAEIFDLSTGSPLYANIEQLFQTIVSRSTIQSDTTLQQEFQDLQLDNRTWTSTMSHIGIEDQIPAPAIHGLQVRTPTLSPADATTGSSETFIIENVVVVPDFGQAPMSTKLPCYMLQSVTLNPDFFGRQDILGKLDEELLPSTDHAPSTPRAFALCGYGGVGKTQTAMQFALTRKDKYDAIFWVQADTGAKLEESFSQISFELNLEDPSAAVDRVVSRNLVMEWLSNPVTETDTQTQRSVPPASTVKWLLIFDNADDPSLLRDYWPIVGNGAMLVTSRDPLAKSNLYSRKGLDLEPLDHDTAAALLRKLTDRSETDEDTEFALAIAKRMGGLPLAMTQVAAAIQRQDLTFAEFLSLYEEEPSVADIKEISLRPGQEYKHNIFTVWAFDGLSQGSMCLLQLLALLDPDSISEAIITQETISQLPSGYPNSRLAFLEARTSLLKSSLVKRSKELSQLTIHRITQDAIRSKMSLEEWRTAFTVATKLLFNFWPKAKVPFSYNVKNWDASQKIVPHILHVKTLWHKIKSIEPDVESIGQFAHLLGKVGWYFAERGTPKEGQTILVLAKEVCEEHPGLFQEAYADTMFALAATSGHVNEPGPALEYAKKHLELRLEMGGKEDLYLGTAYNQLGMASNTNDLYEQAIEAFRKSLDVYSRTPETISGQYRPDFPNIGLAWALSENKQNDEAAEILLENVRFRATRYGPDDTESLKLGASLQALGNVRERQGRWADSFDAHRRALVNYLATTGPNNFRTGQVCVKLGEHYTRLGQFQMAEAHFEQALKIFSGRAYYKGETARTTYKLAQLHRAMRDGPAAEGLMLKAETLYREIVHGGASHGATLQEIDYDKLVAFWSR